MLFKRASHEVVCSAPLQKCAHLFLLSPFRAPLFTLPGPGWQPGALANWLLRGNRKSWFSKIMHDLRILARQVVKSNACKRQSHICKALEVRQTHEPHTYVKCIVVVLMLLPVVKRTNFCIWGYLLKSALAHSGTATQFARKPPSRRL